MSGHSKNPKTKVVLSVDTEPSIAGAFVIPAHKPLLHEPVAGEVNGRSEALGCLVWIRTVCLSGTSMPSIAVR